MTTEAQTIRKNVTAYLKEINVTYSAVFVPQRLSRHSDNKDKSINWRVMFHHDTRDTEFSTHYMQGIGHLPTPKIPSTATIRHYAQREREKMAAEEGTHYSEYKWGMGRTGLYGSKIQMLPQPIAADVLYCLVLDADAIDCVTFEEWADNYGYDTDSRKAEDIYNECRKQSREMRKVFTQAQILHIAELVREL